MNVLRCALSGETPPTDPVITPSGYICSKKVLFSKLAENGGRDPFSNTSLDAQSVIVVKDNINESSRNMIQPPRFPRCTSIGGILHQLKSSYDAILLELYDTRRALEETRRELTVALYQNDAAVRVISRLSMERDNARKEFSKLIPCNKTDVYDISDGDCNKRKKLQNLEMNKVPRVSDSQPISDSVSTSEISADVIGSMSMIKNNEREVKNVKLDDKISEEHINTMVNKWKELSSARRSARKIKPLMSEFTMDSISKYEPVLEKKIHKSSSPPGVLGLALTTGVDGIGSGHILATVSKDNQIALYDTERDEIIREISTDFRCNGCIDILRLPYCSMKEKKEEFVNYAVCVADDDENIVNWFGPKSQLSYRLIDDFATVVNISIHPTGRHVFVTTNNGNIHVLFVEDDNVEMTNLAILQDINTLYTTAKLHPDGLILVAGRKDGRVSIWDLKTQVLASSLKGLKDNAITAVAFSENGYNFATATLEGPVVIWDLRKQNVVATLYPPFESMCQLSNVDIMGKKPKTVYSLTFDPSGRFLACGTFSNEILMIAVKNPEQVVTLTDSMINNVNNSKTNHGKICELLWDGNRPSLISCSNTEKIIKFWSIPKYKNDRNK